MASLSHLAVLVLACGALVGWAWDFRALTSFGPGLSTLKPNTAVCFIALAVGQSLTLDIHHGRRRGIAALALALLVAILGLVTCVEYLSGTSSFLDRWLLPDEVASGRMGFNTSAAFVLSAMGLVFLRPVSARAAAVGQGLSLASGWFAGVSVLGYLHSLRSLGAVSSYTEMSIPTTVAFGFLTVGGLCARPDWGLVRLARSPYSGGVALRRILPAGLVVPVILGWLVLEGSRAAWYPSALNLPLLSALTIVVFTGLVYGAAVALDRKDAERDAIARALERSEAVYRDLFHNVPTPVFQSSGDGRLKNVNRALVQLLGFGSRDELLDLHLSDIGFPLDALVPAGGPTELGALRNVEVELRRRDGSTVTALVNARVVGEGTDRGGYHEAALTDISERKVLEQQLRQTQKMEAIGKLAGGIAHDFNNTLTAITGYADILRAEFPRRLSARRSVEEITKAADRAAALTRQLLTFSRQQVLEPEVLDVGETVRALAPMLRRIVGEQYFLELRLSDGLDAIKADRGQIDQVLMNLTVNARDAMPDGGTIAIEAENVTLDADYVDSHLDAAPNRYVLLSVTDTGVGMDEETQSHVFEPFFTTKEVGRGTGLGLATVHGIVKQSGGTIWIYSEPGRGTTFKVYLPVTEEVAGPRRSPRQPPPTRTCAETVLVVEDESAVRALIAHILQGAGYEVIEAAEPKQALARAQALDWKFDLLLTDVVMPSGTGVELLRRFRVERPQIKAVFMSGYAAMAVVQNSEVELDVPYLQKPFSADKLLTIVGGALDATPG